MSHVNCRVYRDFERPSRALIEKFRGIPVANLDDCMGRQAAVNAAIKPIGNTTLVGPAFTVKVAPGDNLMLHYAMDLVKEGDVIVIDAGGYTERAIFGEIMVQYLLTKKIAGIIVDGAMRDKEDIAATGLPVYTRAVIPDGPWKNGPGEINTIVNCGGRSVSPGDIVVADADGIVFMKPADAESVLEKVQGLMAGEAKSLKAIAETGALPRPWVMEKLQALGCEFFDEVQN